MHTFRYKPLFQARFSPDFIAFDCSDQINKADIRAQTVPASAKCGQYTSEAGGEGALVELANYALARSAIIFSPENICLRGLSGVTLFLHHYSFIIQPANSPCVSSFLEAIFDLLSLTAVGSRICFILSHRHTASSPSTSTARFEHAAFRCNKTCGVCWTPSGWLVGTTLGRTHGWKDLEIFTACTAPPPRRLGIAKIPHPDRVSGTCFLLG